MSAEEHYAGGGRSSSYFEHCIQGKDRRECKLDIPAVVLERHMLMWISKIPWREEDDLHFNALHSMYKFYRPKFESI